MKAHDTEDIDLIIYGDSRVSEGVDTRPFQEAFPDSTPRNMGFSTGGFNAFMFDYLRGICAGKESRLILILGVTPYGLTRETAGNGHFLKVWNLPGHEVKKRLSLNPLLGFFEPVAPSMFYHIEKKSGRFVTYNRDGWEETYELPFNPTRWLRAYEKAFQRTQVDPENVRATFGFVGEMSAKGIKVFGFRPPTTPSMESIEDQRSGFREADFIQGFEAAGGRWIHHQDRFGYFSYDGSHLHFKAARSFSKDLARAVKEAMP